MTSLFPMKTAFLTQARDVYYNRWGAGYFYQSQDAFTAYDNRLAYILNYKGAYSGKVWKSWPEAIVSFNLQVSLVFLRDASSWY